MPHRFAPPHFCRCRSPRLRFPWREIQVRRESIIALQSSPSATVPDEAVLNTSLTPTTQSLPFIANDPLKGISITYHLRRRMILNLPSRAPKHPRIIGIRDPVTGYLFLDGPGVDHDEIKNARHAYTSFSVAERRRILQQEMAMLKQGRTLLMSARDFSAKELEIKSLLKRQLLNCVTGKDIFKVAAAAFQSRRTTARLANMGEPLMRAFFRSRTNTSDASIASRILVLIGRFDQIGIDVQPTVITNGLKFAIRSRSLRLTHRFLRILRDRNIEVSSATFRSVVAKCSIGRQGFGEIRNGRWKRDELMQVLLGFKDDIPGKECHLKTFVTRNDWQFIAAWSQILSRIGAHDELWQEWLLWKKSDARRIAKPLNHCDKPPSSPWTWGQRGDRWFVQVFIDAGLIDWAWKVLKETNLNPLALRRECLHQLLERADRATFWNETLRMALLEKLSEDLAAIEQMLGVEWVTKNGISFHAPHGSADEAWEMLSEKDFFTKYGYISDDDVDE